ncbi:MAG: DUF6049 family protein [Actinomycetota bacterium]|nr:DUF6049 family protein [Actinomycetota bacterium]
MFSRRRHALISSALTLGLGLGLLAATPAGAQEPQATVRLVSQPPWHEADDKLGLRLRVTNNGAEPLDGFAVQTKIYGRIITRTELHESFDGPDGFELIVPLPVTFDNVSLAPGESTVVRIRTDVAELLGFQEEGVYPMTVTLFDLDLTTLLDSFTTALVYYPDKVTKPLNFSFVVPLFGTPMRGPDGTFFASSTVATATGSEGWMTGLVDAVAGAVEEGARLAMVPSPRTLDELADVANGYTPRTGEPVGRDDEVSEATSDNLETLEEVLAGGAVTPIASPYAPVDLPAVIARLEPHHLTRQLAEGRTVLSEVLGDVEVDGRWLFATGSRWDEGALGSVVAQHRDLQTFFSAESFEIPIDDAVPGCPEGAPDGSFTCPVRVDNPVEGVATPGLVRDPDVQERLTELTRPGEDALDLQLFFTETAFIHLENPDLKKRVLQATLPSTWHPSPAQSQRLLAGLTEAPWLDMLTPDEALAAATKPRPRQVVPRAPTLEGEPLPGYFTRLRSAEERLELYAELGPPPERLERLRRNLLTAESRVWWIDAASQAQGLSYAEETLDEIEGELGKIRVDGLDTTLTSRRSPLQLFLYNEADYPVTVDVVLGESTGEIRVAGNDVDELTGLRVGAGQQIDVNVEVIAESSGIFGLSASVRTPDSGEEIYSKSIRVRSTNFNVIALAITFGALAFLILFYVLRLLRRRKIARAESATA